MAPSRHTAGTPGSKGGQFAATSRDEADLTSFDDAIFDIRAAIKNGPASNAALDAVESPGLTADELAVHARSINPVVRLACAWRTDLPLPAALLNDPDAFVRIAAAEHPMTSALDRAAVLSDPETAELYAVLNAERSNLPAGD